MKRKDQNGPAFPDTRDRLITAGIDAFGRKGFDGTSIREIASAAGINLAGIAYHFGGKDQLYRACLTHIVSTIAGGVQRRIGAAPQELPSSQDGAREAMKQLLQAMAEVIIATPKLTSFARVIVREQMDPSPAFPILYDTFMAPMHARLCRLWGVATGRDPDSEDVKLAVFSLVGGILVFRITRAGVLKRMGWKDIGARELKAISHRISENIDCLTGAPLRGD